MELEEIERYLKLMQRYTVAELEVDGLRVRMDVAPPQPAVAVVATAPVATAAPQVTTEAEGSLVKSPMVGTFYRAAKPGSPPFIEVGDAVITGQVLCIVEAMKLMNEIEAEVDGVIAEIRAENGQPLQFGQVLFRITTA